MIFHETSIILKKLIHEYTFQLFLKKMLKIHDFVDSITIENMQDSITLELKLNVTQYGHPWKHIGDVLFEFNSSNSMRTFPVPPHQFEFLEMLHTTKSSWAECKDLE